MKVYGFFWCDCIYESEMGLQSAHQTKKGAYLAMRRNLYQIWVDHRLSQLNGLYKACAYDKRDYKNDSYDKPIDLTHTAWEVSEIEVLP